MFVKLFVIYIGVTVVTCRQVQFFRKDYTYIEEFDAFYKLHWDVIVKDWESALNACIQEDAKLFYPKKLNEWTVVQNLTDSMSETLNISNIYVAIQNYGVQNFLTTDGLTTPYPLVNEQKLSEGNLCGTLDIETGALHVDHCNNEELIPKSFVCKKVEDVTCPTIDKKYTYEKNTKKCYKVNDYLKSWHDALQTCIMEGGILAVIETELEADIIFNKLDLQDLYYVGFKRHRDIGFYTLKDQKLKDVYYQWYQFEDQTYDCGAVKRFDHTNSLYTDTLQCYNLAKFICEMNVKE